LTRLVLRCPMSARLPPPERWTVARRSIECGQITGKRRCVSSHGLPGRFQEWLLS
jgi:hypothetical protein